MERQLRARGLALCVSLAVPLAACGNSDITCDTGFELTDGICKDIDECTDGAFDCDPNADCINTKGSYTCLCREEFRGDGVTCAPAGHCVPNPCAHGTCRNVPSGFACTCEPGWEGVACDTDVAECALALDNCDRVNGTCIEDEGGYHCACTPPATAADEGPTCEATCATTCDVNARCVVDGVGGTSCVCNAGYDGDGETCAPL